MTPTRTERRLAVMLRDFCAAWDCGEEAALERLIREWRSEAQARWAMNSGGDNANTLYAAPPVAKDSE